MPLTPEQVDTIDGKTPTKADLEKALHEHGDDHPGLLEITADEYKRDIMIKKAKEVVSSQVSAEVKREAVRSLIEKRSSAVVIPIVQPYMLLLDPQQVEKPFVLSVYSDMGNTDTNPRRPELVPEDEREQYSEVSPQGTKVSDLPEWSFIQVYDMIEKGHIRVFDSAEAAAAYSGLSSRNQEQVPILDDATASSRFELTRTRSIGDQPGAVYERVSDNRTGAEQKAARAVLFEEVNQDPPLPANSKEVSPDPSTITQAEVDKVRHRIKDCLENPRRYAQAENLRTFDKRTFFSQLLADELAGFTPGRRQGEKIAGRPRPTIVKLIRGIASDYNFDVVGDYVVPRPIEELKEGMPMPDTVPMTPEQEREMDYPEGGGRRPEKVTRSYFD